MIASYFAQTHVGPWFLDSITYRQIKEYTHTYRFTWTDELEVPSELPVSSRSELPCCAAGQQIAFSVLGDKCVLGRLVAWVPANLPALLDTLPGTFCWQGDSLDTIGQSIFLLKDFMCLQNTYSALSQKGGLCRLRGLGKESQAPWGSFCSCSWSHIKLIA